MKIDIKSSKFCEVTMESMERSDFYNENVRKGIEKRGHVRYTNFCRFSSYTILRSLKPSEGSLKDAITMSTVAKNSISRGICRAKAKLKLNDEVPSAIHILAGSKFWDPERNDICRDLTHKDGVEMIRFLLNADMLFELKRAKRTIVDGQF